MTNASVALTTRVDGVDYQERDKEMEIASKPAVIYLPDPNMLVALYTDPIRYKVLTMTTEEDGERDPDHSCRESSRQEMPQSVPLCK
jgi:hypothetical protein